MVSIDGGWRSVLPTWWTLHRPLLTAQGSQQSLACAQIENGEHLGFKLSKCSSQDHFDKGCEGHGFLIIEDCITLHSEVKWSLTSPTIFQKSKKVKESKLEDSKALRYKGQQEQIVGVVKASAP